VRQYSVTIFTYVNPWDLLCDSLQKIDILCDLNFFRCKKEDLLRDLNSFRPESSSLKSIYEVTAHYYISLFGVVIHHNYDNRNILIPR
jgi:hypothetical protein